MPNALSILLSRDLLEQLEAKIIFKNGEIILEVKDQQYVELLSLMLITMRLKLKVNLKYTGKEWIRYFPWCGFLIYQGQQKMHPQCKLSLKKGNSQLNNTP